MSMSLSVHLQKVLGSWCSAILVNILNIDLLSLCPP